jgi:exodeoxyribonuclease VII large subunit
MYADLKDADACLNVICWKTALPKLSVKPEEGLEVVCTGRVSSYPARSNYQLIIESMELAGAGALLKMLEERRKKLAAEGLFDADRKKKLPFLPNVVGVITSPTGAVIRDIMHRLDDRFPRHVLLWPVLVQGPGAAEQIAAAIKGFDALPVDGKVSRPDILIVARGGGALEDLMPFNEEIVVRAAAACRIPLISAVGHETDTTLIDHAADVRAPTPTAAAEMAVPVRLELLGWLSDSNRRLTASSLRLLSDLRNRLAAIAARLGDPQRLLEMQSQLLDHAGHKLGSAFRRGLDQKTAVAGRLGAQLRKPSDRLREAEQDLKFRTESLRRALDKLVRDAETHLRHEDKLLKSYSYEHVLARGYVVVRSENGKPVTSVAKARTGENVQLEFQDGRRKAVIGDH